MIEALQIFVCCSLGIFAALAFTECEHVKAERRKRRQTERWVSERIQNH